MDKSELKGMLVAFYGAGGRVKRIPAGKRGKVESKAMKAVETVRIVTRREDLAGGVEVGPIIVR